MKFIKTNLVNDGGKVDVFYSFLIVIPDCL